LCGGGRACEIKSRGHEDKNWGKGVNSYLRGGEGDLQTLGNGTQKVRSDASGKKGESTGKLEKAKKSASRCGLLETAGPGGK